MKPELLQLDPISIYLDYLIRQSLPKNAPLSPRDIILSRVLSGPCLDNYPNTLVIEHRQTRPFNELALQPGESLPIDDMMFKSTLTSKLNLTTRRIQADVMNCKGWLYGRPILVTIATIVDASGRAMERVLESGEPLNFIMTNTYLGEIYKGPTEGLEHLPELKDLLDKHMAELQTESVKSNPSINAAVA